MPRINVHTDRAFLCFVVMDQLTTESIYTLLALWQSYE